VRIPEVGVDLVGLDDSAKARFDGVPPTPAADIMPETDGFKIIMVHNPANLERIRVAGADLMLAGHTHDGQLFPLNFLVGAMYPLAYGRGKFGAMDAYVSCGIGVWGPAVRTAGAPEIVVISVASE
jgi:predicted MPP superfamily phosphohydrolase